MRPRWPASSRDPSSRHRPPGLRAPCPGLAVSNRRAFRSRGPVHNLGPESEQVGGSSTGSPQGGQGDERQAQGRGRRGARGGSRRRGSRHVLRDEPAGKCASGETRLVWNGPGTWPTPPASPTADAFGDGTWRVGSEITPGTYRALGDGSTMQCSWERLSGFSGLMKDTIALGYEPAPVVVTIEPTDAGFKSKHCGRWTKVQ